MRFLSVAVVLLAPAVPTVVAGTTYYVDSRAGDDGAAGTSATKPWKSLEKVGGHDFKPGDAVSFKRGSSWSGTLTLSANGTAAKPIVVQAYGSGATPKISGGEPACVSISGNYWRVTGVRASSCAWSGFEVAGDGNQLVGVEADHNIAGVWVTPDGRRNVIRDSRLSDNNKMSVDTGGGDDDSGAFGVLLNGDDNLVTGNTISGSYASSHDYKTDGAAVEVYNGDRNRVTRNFSRNNETFTELGAEKGKTATGNVFAFNVVTSSRSRGSFLITRGPKHVVGPVKGTVAVHNSVYLKARDTIGWSCHDGCSPSILRLRNNVIVVGGQMGYEDGSGADEAGNVYQGRTKKFKLGPKSVIADPLYVSKSDLHLRPGSPALGHAVSLKASWYGGAASSAPNSGAYQ